MTIDRISQLSDDILHHILSFVNAKHAVQTSVLSHRWRHVWTSMNTLNFDFTSYPFDGPDDFGLKAESFRRFISRFLSGDSCMSIKKFNYTFVEQDLSLNHEIFKDVFFHVVRRNIQDFRIYSTDFLPVDWCTSLSTCESLAEINWIVGCDSAWNSFSHSTIKNMYLEDYDWKLCLEGDLVSECPNLETLVLKRFDLSNLRITAEMLTFLELTHVFFPYDSDIVLSTPRLKSLKLDFVGLFPSVQSDNLSSIENLEILRASESCFYATNKSRTRLVLRNLIHLFKLASNTKSLVLSAELVEIFSTEPEWLRRWHSLLPNMRQLKLKVDEDGAISVPISLLWNFYSARNVNVEII